MPSTKNKVIIASAGSGKTTFVVEEALRLKDKKLLITTYTNENVEQIKAYLIAKAGTLPANIVVQPWFTFLLHDGVRPYQNHMNDRGRVHTINFRGEKPKYQKKDDYFTTSNDIYGDKVSEFVYECDKKTKGFVIKRLEKIYQHVFIDELQDFAGYDLNFLECLFHSNINILAVGDPRQATFSTNRSSKNRQFRRINIYPWLKEKEKERVIAISERNECFRCNQTICDFADRLFPEFPKTKSVSSAKTAHEGLFQITQEEVKEYVAKYNPTILRYSKRANTSNLKAMNIGISKGRTFDRVLVFPTKPMLEYLKTNDLSKVGDVSKLYVAVTRARHSVAFVID